MKRTYLELRKVAEKYHNDRGYCTVLATATVCEMSFSKTFYKLQATGRKTRTGIYQPQYFDLIKARGFDIVKLRDFRRCPVSQVLKQIPKKGKFLVNIRQHVIAVVDGVINDWTEDEYHRGHVSRTGRPCARPVLEVHEIIKSTKPKGRVL